MRQLPLFALARLSAGLLWGGAPAAAPERLRGALEGLGATSRDGADPPM